MLDGLPITISHPVADGEIDNSFSRVTNENDKDYESWTVSVDGPVSWIISTRYHQEQSQGARRTSSIGRRDHHTVSDHSSTRKENSASCCVDEESNIKSGSRRPSSEFTTSNVRKPCTESIWPEGNWILQEFLFKRVFAGNRIVQVLNSYPRRASHHSWCHLGRHGWAIVFKL